MAASPLITPALILSLLPSHTYFSTAKRCVATANIQPHTCVAVGLCEELGAGVEVSKGSYSQTVGRMELRAQELTTSLFHLVQLEQTRCRQECLRSRSRLLLHDTDLFIKRTYCSQMMTSSIKPNGLWSSSVQFLCD